MRTADDLVRVEVHYCVSSLVSTLAGGAGSISADGRIPIMRDNRVTDLQNLTEQAVELACPIDDWEEAARQVGWEWKDGPRAFWLIENHECTDTYETVQGDWIGLCEWFNIEPYQREVFEHWIVSDWLADKLAERGEKVDKDFAGLTVWARTTTGQGIASDAVIIEIAADLART